MNGRSRLDLVNQLKIDKDLHVDPTWVQAFVQAIVQICKLNGVRVTSIRMCHSTCKGQHYYIDIKPPLRAESANRLQWLLGDDCRRVDYNRARIRSGYPDWNKLFERIGQRYTTLYRVKVPAGTRKTPKEALKK